MILTEITEDERLLILKAAAEAQTWKVNRWLITFTLLTSLALASFISIVFPSPALRWPQLLTIFSVFILWLIGNWQGKASHKLALICEEALRGTS